MTTVVRNGTTAVKINDDVKIDSASQMLDIIATAQYEHPEHAGLIVSKHSLPDEFFDLKTKLAGEMLQKFSNYRVKLAIIGDFGNIESKALADFIRECNRGRQIFFVEDEAQALTKLEGK